MKQLAPDARLVPQVLTLIVQLAPEIRVAPQVFV
jgi:hypothetical protein